jgi:hypothetical protein
MSRTDSHPALAVLLDAADGRFPVPDGTIRALPPFGPRLEAVISFTGHSVICSRFDLGRLVSLGADGYGQATHPQVLTALAGSGTVGELDVTLVARGTGRGASGPVLPDQPEWADHPRVRYAQQVRANVRVVGDDRGLVTLANGLGGRRELSIELFDGFGLGHGRALLRDALTLVPQGEPVFAAVSPGNARSLRSFLAAGFVPIGSEVIIQPGGAP